MGHNRIGPARSNRFPAIRPESGGRPLSWTEYDAVHSVLINAGEAFRHWRRWSDAARLFQQSLAVAERQGDAGVVGYSCHNRGDVALARADFAAARAWYERAAEAWAHSGEAWTEMVAHTHLGLAWACEGRWEEALPCLERAHAVGERMEPTQWLGEVWLWSSLAVLRSGGDEGLARTHHDRAAAVARAAGQALPAGLRHLAQGSTEARAGRLEASWEHYRKAQGLWPTSPSGPITAGGSSAAAGRLNRPRPRIQQGVNTALPYCRQLGDSFILAWGATPMSDTLERRTVSFIFRLWAEPSQGGSRAHLRGQIEHVGTGEKTHFLLPAALVDFLSAHLPVPAADAAAAVQPEGQARETGIDG